MNKLLVICGPTATGKTKLGLRLAKKYKGEIISADSRQVYKGMDIGTGKDHPKGAKIWGIDLVSPKQEFSVADYNEIARKIIKDIWKKGKLPILVGGTGLYIKAVIDGIETVDVLKNKSLRDVLEKKGADELFIVLKKLDSKRALDMNVSDRRNKRRLIRAIEIANSGVKIYKKPKRWDELMIGLKLARKELNLKIEARVDKRVRDGVEGEIKKLLKNGIGWDSQAMSALGYRQWRKYFEGTESKDEVIGQWKSDEKRYAKRQILWFKKDQRVNWFGVGSNNWQKDVEELVGKWYATSKDAKKNRDFS